MGGSKDGWMHEQMDGSVRIPARQTEKRKEESRWLSRHSVSIQLLQIYCFPGHCPCSCFVSRAVWGSWKDFTKSQKTWIFLLHTCGALSDPWAIQKVCTNFLISNTKLMPPLLSVLYSFLGIRYDNGCGRCSAVRKPSYRVIFCEMFTGIALLSLLPFTAAQGWASVTHTRLTENRVPGDFTAPERNRVREITSWGCVTLCPGKGLFFVLLFLLKMLQPEGVQLFQGE